MPLETVEVRWFGPGAPSPADWDWFTSLYGPAFLRTKQRADSYVVLPGIDDLGIKWRGKAAFDLKARRRELGEIRLSGEHDSSPGRVEEWIKWTYPLDENSSLARAVAQLPRMPVGKTRVHYLFDISEAAEPWATPVPLSPEGEFPRVDLGLFLELAGVECAGRFAWSLAIEASAEAGPRFEAALQVVCEQIVRGPLALESAESIGYPAWLGSISNPSFG